MRTFLQIKASVVSLLRPDSPGATLDNISDTALKQWANEEATTVIKYFGFRDPLGALLVYGESLTDRGLIDDARSFQIPDAFEHFGNLKADGVACEKYDMAKFALFDSSNFLVTPSEKLPVCAVGSDRFLVKPQTASAVVLSYVKRHPEINDANGTLWNDEPDRVIEHLIAARVLMFRKLDSRAAYHLKRAASLAGGE